MGRRTFDWYDLEEGGRRKSVKEEETGRVVRREDFRGWFKSGIRREKY